MKIIDFSKKGNVVRFFLGDDDCNDYTGDDWNDVPYYCNAEPVDGRYVKGHRDIAFPFDYAVVEPKDPEWEECFYSKDDMKECKVPCIVVVPNPDTYFDDDFNRMNADERAIRFYFGDAMSPSDKLEVWHD